MSNWVHSDRFYVKFVAHYLPKKMEFGTLRSVFKLWLL